MFRQSILIEGGLIDLEVLPMPNRRITNQPSGESDVRGPRPNQCQLVPHRAIYYVSNRTTAKQCG
jgi:hypothetical protein